MSFLDDLMQWWVSAPATKGFPRKVQLDGYSCAARSTQMALAYYERRVPIETVIRGVKTDEDGTYMTNVAKFLRKKGLKVGIYPKLTLAQLQEKLLTGIAIVDVDHSEHAAVVHDIDETHVHIADPSAVRCFWGRQARSTFRQRWSGWAMIVTSSRGRTTPSLNSELEVKCPVTDDPIYVPADSDYDYTCPDCNGDIEVDDDFSVTHEDICRFTCPVSGKEDIIWESDWEDGNELECDACGKEIRIDVAGNLDISVFHELDYN